MIPITPREAMDRAKLIALMCRVGKLEYDEAKAQCASLLTIVNKRGAEIARDFNQKYRPVTFTALAR